MLTAILPLLVTERVCEVAFPTGTFPKLTLLELTWKDAVEAGCVFEAFTTPAHPLSSIGGSMATRSRRVVSLFHFLCTTHSLSILVPARCIHVLGMPLASVVPSTYEGNGNGTRRPTGETTNFGTAAGTVRWTILLSGPEPTPLEIRGSGYAGTRPGSPLRLVQDIDSKMVTISVR